LTEEQVLDVLFDQIGVSNLSNGVSAVDSLYLFLVILMRESGQKSNRFERNVRFFSDNDDLFEV